MFFLTEKNLSNNKRNQQSDQSFNEDSVLYRCVFMTYTDSGLINVKQGISGYTY